MPVNESASLERALTDDVGATVDRVILNGLYPERFSADEVPKLEATASESEGAVRAACRAALSQCRRAAGQREQLARLEQLVSAPVSTLPFVFEPQLEIEQVRGLAAEVA
jgi:hypothetical protein